MRLFVKSFVPFLIKPKRGSGMSISLCRVSVGMLAILSSLFGNVNQVVAAQKAVAFPVRALNVAFRPQIQSLSFYQGIINQAEKLGYNMLILGTGGIRQSAFTIDPSGDIHFHKWSKSQVSQLLNDARQAGLEPVFEVKNIGKHRPLLAKVSKEYPGLLTKHGILNPAYRFPDGQGAYDAIELPMLGHFIALYGNTPPRYFLLGVDEVAVDDLAVAAKALNTTTPKLFAKLLNQSTQYLIKQNITPVIWGDMFISEQLRKPGHGVIGFDHDDRIQGGHANYLSTKKNSPSTLTSINDLKSRNQIIVADWHYWAQRGVEYPSVDYFQTMGFKDVWGATWYDGKGIRLFAKYAAKRQCGGMIATAWHTTISPSVRHLFKPLMNNSAVYFRDPNFELPQWDIVSSLAPTKKENTFSVASQQKSGVFLESARTFSYSVQLPPNSKPKAGATLEVSHVPSIKSDPLTVPLRFESGSNRLVGSFSLPQDQRKLPRVYKTNLRWIDSLSGYMFQIHRPSHFIVTKQKPAQAGIANLSAWFAADFSKLSQEELSRKVFYTSGQFPILLHVESPTLKAQSDSGALNSRANGSWGYAPQKMWDQILTKGMRLNVDFKVTDSFKSKGGYCALVSYGNYGEGFRLLMSTQNTFLLQFAKQNGGAPIWIPSPVKVPLNQWASVEVTITPAKTGRPRVVTLTVNHQKPAIVNLPRPILERNTAVLGLGVEFRAHGSMKKMWPNFPGLIQRVLVKPYALHPTQ